MPFSADAKDVSVIRDMVGTSKQDEQQYYKDSQRTLGKIGDRIGDLKDIQALIVYKVVSSGIPLHEHADLK